MPGCRCWTKLTREPLCLFYNASPIGCTTRERSVRWLLGQDGGTGPEQPFDEAITNRWNFQIFASQPVRRSVIASRDPPDNLFLRRQLRENWSAPDKSYTCCIFSFSFLFLSFFLFNRRTIKRNVALADIDAFLPMISFFRQGKEGSNNVERL